jgi:hypothetical protein
VAADSTIRALSLPSESNQKAAYFGAPAAHAAVPSEKQKGAALARAGRALFLW